jgi:hypothetical protein
MAKITVIVWMKTKEKGTKNRTETYRYCHFLEKMTTPVTNGSFCKSP